MCHNKKLVSGGESEIGVSVGGRPFLGNFPRMELFPSCHGDRVSAGRPLTHIQPPYPLSPPQPGLLRPCSLKTLSTEVTSVALHTTALLSFKEQLSSEPLSRRKSRAGPQVCVCFSQTFSGLSPPPGPLTSVPLSQPQRQPSTLEEVGGLGEEPELATILIVVPSQTWRGEECPPDSSVTRFQTSGAFVVLPWGYYSSNRQRPREAQKLGCWRFSRQLGLDYRRESRQSPAGTPPSLHADLGTGLGARFLSSSSLRNSQPSPLPCSLQQTSLLPTPPGQPLSLPQDLG